MLFPNKKQWLMAVASLFKQLLFRLRLMERRHLSAIRKNKAGLLAKFTHSSLFSLKTNPFSRGLAIGMFWAFIPMPFQMVPATLFCLMGYANLPIALLCVWISNPLTYIPIFYLEYKIGAWLYTDEGDWVNHVQVDFSEFSGFYETSHSIASELLVPLLKGGLTVAVVFAIIGYLIGYPLSAYLRRHSKRRKKKSNAHTR